MAARGLYIFGAGGHAKQVIDIFQARKIKIRGVFDDHKKPSETYYYKYRIIDKISNATKYLKKTIFCSAPLVIIE